MTVAELKTLVNSVPECMMDCEVRIEASDLIDGIGVDYYSVTGFLYKLDYCEESGGRSTFIAISGI